MTGTLILVRHGESEWNLKNLFTGWRNPDLTEKGIEEARATGKALKAAGIVPDLYYTSALRRAQRDVRRGGAGALPDCAGSGSVERRRISGRDVLHRKHPPRTFQLQHLTPELSRAAKRLRLE